MLNLVHLVDGDVRIEGAVLLKMREGVFHQGVNDNQEKRDGCDDAEPQRAG